MRPARRAPPPRTGPERRRARRRGGCRRAACASCRTPPARLSARSPSEAQRRVPTADLDERDPDYIRETLPRPLDAREPLLPRRGARPREHPRGGPGAARGQPLGRQHDRGHGRLHARVQHLLRRGAALPPAGPQPRALDARASASCASTARWPPPRRTPQRRSTRAPRCWSTRAATTRCTGRPGSRRRWTSTAARASSAWRSSTTCRSCPVVSIGGQETALFLIRGEGLAKLLRLDRMFRLKVLPISLALPWGLNVGDMLGHVPLPAKITIEVLEPIDLSRGSDLDEVYDEVLGRMQAALTALRRSGACRCSADAGRARASRSTRSREEIWERVADPGHYPASWRASRARAARGTAPEGLGARYSTAHARGLGRRGRPRGGRGVRRARRPRWTNVTGIDQRGRWRLRETADGRTKVTLRLSYDAPGGLLGMVSDRISAPMVARPRAKPSTNLERSSKDEEVGRGERTRRKSLPGRLAYELGQREGAGRRGRDPADAARTAW